MKKIILSTIVTLGICLGANAQKKVKLEDNTNATDLIYKNGNVGIGITSPSEKLQIENGVVKVRSNNNSNRFIWSRTDNTMTAGLAGDGARKLFFLADNSTQMTVDGNTGNVGIGTTSPNQKLDVLGNIYLNSLSATSSTNKVNSSKILFKSSGYASDNRARYQLWEVLSVGKSVWGSGDLVFNSNTDGAGINERVRFSANGNVGIGTASPDMKLTVKGNIHAEEVKIDLSVPAPDYVFKDDYKLRSIEEVEKFIKKNSHLPEIPSAKEFEQNGVMQAEMDMSLLKKIEELTLYTIQQEKEIKKLKEQDSRIEKQKWELKNQKKEIEELKSLVTKLLESKK